MLFDQFLLEIPDDFAHCLARTHAVLWNTVCDCAKPMHLRCTLEKYRFPMFFNGFHVAHLARSPRSARARRSALRHRVAVGRGHTVKSFIFTSVYKGISIMVRF